MLVSRNVFHVVLALQSIVLERTDTTVTVLHLACFSPIKNSKTNMSLSRLVSAFKILWILIIWLVLRAGKMNQIPRCDCLPERARWSHLARSGLHAVSRKQNFPKSHIINPLLTKFVQSRWLDIGLVLFFASLWTSTSSRSINTQRKNLANIQPS